MCDDMMKQLYACGSVTGRMEMEMEFVRGHPSLYVPLYIPYLSFTFYIHLLLFGYHSNLSCSQ